jgi:hypothetical protein
LKAALAEPAIKESLTVAEQEPVAWMNKHGACVSEVFKKIEANVEEYTTPLYTAPPRREAQEPMHPEIKTICEDYFDRFFRESSAPPRREWVGLTDEEIADIANSCRWSNTYHADFARAIEAKLREKNS